MKQNRQLSDLQNILIIPNPPNIHITSTKIPHIILALQPTASNHQQIHSTSHHTVLHQREDTQNIQIIALIPHNTPHTFQKLKKMKSHIVLTSMISYIGITDQRLMKNSIIIFQKTKTVVTVILSQKVSMMFTGLKQT